MSWCDFFKAIGLTDHIKLCWKLWRGEKNMTIDFSIGKLKAKLEHTGVLGKRSREVELNIQWVSCGVYQITYYRPRDAKPHYVITAEDWYPPDTSICFTPEQFEKVAELYPDAPKNERQYCYKPFYEEFNTSRGMMDFGDDYLFQAYKEPKEGIDKVYLVIHNFCHGEPTPDSSCLGLYMDDFNKLKEIIDSKKDEIFYSGCKVSGTLLDNLKNAIAGEGGAKEEIT